MWCCNLRWKIHIFGSFQLIACTPPNQPMRPCLLEPLISILGKFFFGKAGPQGNASSSCGQWVTIDAGQLTDYHDKASFTHQSVHFVIRLEKR